MYRLIFVLLYFSNAHLFTKTLTLFGLEGRLLVRFT